MYIFSITPQPPVSRSCIAMHHQDSKTNDDINPIIKKEEEENYNNTENFACLHEELDFLIQERNNRFNSLLLDVEEYLDGFVDVEDFKIHSNYLSDTEVESLVKRARMEFKKWGLKAIRSLGDKLKEQSIHHTFPDSYLLQLVETTKQRIFNSYKQLKRNLNEIIINSEVRVKEEQIKMEEDGTNHLKEKKTKNKAKFPKKAKIVLKAWFNINFNDPYPSHEEKIHLAKEGGITIKQLDSWLTNTRGRKWKRKQNGVNFGTEVEYIFLSNNNEL